MISAVNKALNHYYPIYRETLLLSTQLNSDMNKKIGLKIVNIGQNSPSFFQIGQYIPWNCKMTFKIVPMLIFAVRGYGLAH